jgi:flagellar capping protein FliD
MMNAVRSQGAATKVLMQRHILQVMGSVLTSGLIAMACYFAGVFMLPSQVEALRSSLGAMTLQFEKMQEQLESLKNSQSSVPTLIMQHERDSERRYSQIDARVQRVEASHQAQLDSLKLRIESNVRQISQLSHDLLQLDHTEARAHGRVE